jgi:hypothetical protein
MATNTSTADDEMLTTDLDDRTRRALTEHMGIVPEGGDIYTVIGQNSNGEHRVDLQTGRCTCPDYEYNLPTVDGRETCKHYERVLFALGREPVPAAFSPADVPGKLGGDHLDGEPEFLATDGGIDAVAGDDGLTVDDSTDGDTTTLAGLAAESVSHVGPRGLKDWVVIETAMDATAATLRRTAEADR